jgi:hypothetical protein
MREHGIAANATLRVVRGRNRGKTSEAILRAHNRGESTAVRQRATDVAEHLMRDGSFHDPARRVSLQTRHFRLLHPGMSRRVREIHLRRCASLGFTQLE